MVSMFRLWPSEGNGEDERCGGIGLGRAIVAITGGYVLCSFEERMQCGCPQWCWKQGEGDSVRILGSAYFGRVSVECKNRRPRIDCMAGKISTSTC
jgi:hypothetical protein